MEVSDETKKLAAQEPDGEPNRPNPDPEPDPSQPPVIEPDPSPAPAEEPPPLAPDQPVQEPPEEPDEEDAPVEEPPDRHEQETPIEEPPDGAGSPMTVAGAGEEEPLPDSHGSLAEAGAESDTVESPASAGALAAGDGVTTHNGDALSSAASGTSASEGISVSDGDAPEQSRGREGTVESEEPAVVVDADEFLGAQAEDQPTAAAMDEANLRAMVEAVIYVTEEPLTVDQIAAALEQSKEKILQALAEVMEGCADPGRGVSVREVAGGFKMGTKPEHHEAIRTFVKKLKPPLKLSLAALETLAVIAYKQPITAPEIMEVRGVQGAGVIKTLLDRKLIAPAGRKQVVGKPILYKTTKEFLLQFGLKDLAELPTLKEFEELRRLAFSDDEPVAAPVQPAVAQEAVAQEKEPAIEPERPEPRAAAQEAAAPASE